MEEPMLKIITDSASDMPQYIVERFNLHVIPTPVVIDGVDYLDGATIHTKEFYEILMTSAAISKPITSIPLCLRKRSAPMQNITTA